MAKKAATDAEVRAFIEAVFPDAPDLAMAAFDEAHVLRTATALINDLRALADQGQRAEESPSEIERLRSEHAEMLWGLQNVHMLARRALAAKTKAGCREKLPHILRICEQQSPEPLTGGVLRYAPTRTTLHTAANAPTGKE